MSLVTVIAIKDFKDRHGRRFHAGEAVTCEAMQAAAYAQAGHVTIDSSARATYRTTDMIASQDTKPPASPPDTPSRRTRRSRRTKKELTTA